MTKHVEKALFYRNEHLTPGTRAGISVMKTFEAILTQIDVNDAFVNDLLTLIQNISIEKLQVTERDQLTQKLLCIAIGVRNRPYIRHG